MTEPELNKLAFELVSKLETTPREQVSEKPSGSMGERQVLDWSQYRVPGPSIVSSRDRHFGRCIYVEVEGNELKLPRPTYEQYILLTRGIEALPPFSRQVSVAFIENESFLWMASVHENGRAETDLITYLRTQADKEVENVNYHFHVINLNIDQSFKIGNVSFMYFTKDYFDEKLKHDLSTNGDIAEEVFDGLYRKHQGLVFAVFSAKAESNKGRELAYTECCLAIDVLKCFVPTVVLPDEPCYIDLAERLNINFQVESITIPVANPFEMRLTKSARQQLFKIDDVLLMEMRKSGLDFLSSRILNRNQNELSMISTEALKLFSFSISTPDIHLRVVQLISIVEGFVLKEGEKQGFEKLVTKRLYGLHREGMSLMDKSRSLNNLYQVRHQMVHKGKRVQINIGDIGEFQVFIVQSIQKVYALSDTITTKESFISFLDMGASNHKQPLQ